MTLIALLLLAASPRDVALSAVREGADATFAALLSENVTDDLRAARRWATLRADDIAPLEGIRREQLWRSTDCLVAIPAALLLWREATARDVAESKADALAALVRCRADDVWRPTSTTVALVDWHWLDEVGLRVLARERVAERLAESWTWAFAWVELGEFSAPPNVDPRFVQLFAALSRGEWSTVLDMLSKPLIAPDVDAVLRAMALEGLGRHADVGDHFSGRLMAGHPFLSVLQSIAMALRGAAPSTTSLGAFCVLSEQHAIRRWAQARAPSARCLREDAPRLWELPFW